MAQSSHTSTRVSWILVSQDPHISLDLDLRPVLIPLTASPPQIHLALIMSISNLDIVSGVVLSILDLTLVLTEVIFRKIIEERDSRQQQMDSESEVHLDTEVDTAVDSDNEPTPNLCYMEVEIENKTSSSNTCTVNLKLSDSTGKSKMEKKSNKDDQGRTQKHFLNCGGIPAHTMRRSIHGEKESNSASLSKNILIDFKATRFPFILSTNVFQESLSDLESTVGNKLNLRDFNFSYRHPVLTLPSTQK